MKLAHLMAGEDGEYISFGYVEISKIFATSGKIFYGTPPFDKVSKISRILREILVLSSVMGLVVNYIIDNIDNNE